MPRANPPAPKPANLSVKQMEAAIPKIVRRIAELKAFNHQSVLGRDNPQVEALEKKVEATLRDILGHDTLEFQEYGDVNFVNLPIAWGGAGWTALEVQQAVQRGIASTVARLETLRDVFQERIADFVAEEVPALPTKPAVMTGRVFIVHGHDNGMKEAVARVITKLGFEPVVLHEMPNQGKTIIEKFETHAKVDFAIVLFSPDDMGYAQGHPDQAKPRARQNVLLELGFFVGALGRHKVCALFQDGIEKPSDYDGVAYLKFDGEGKWQFDLAKEMRAAGMTVDSNKL